MLYSFLFVCLFVFHKLCVQRREEIIPEVDHVICIIKTKDNKLYKLKRSYSLRKRLFECCAHEVGVSPFLVS